MPDEPKKQNTKVQPSYLVIVENHRHRRRSAPLKVPAQSGRGRTSTQLFRHSLSSDFHKMTKIPFKSDASPIY